MVGDRSQVAVSLRHVLEKEYPDNWSDLVPKVMSFINTQDITRLHGALYTMRIIIKKYEHKPSEGGLREPLNQIVQATFPALLQLFGALAKHTNLEACLLQRILTKIFWSATQVGFPHATLTIHDTRTRTHTINELTLYMIERVASDAARSEGGRGLVHHLHRAPSQARARRGTTLSRGGSCVCRVI